MRVDFQRSTETKNLDQWLQIRTGGPLQEFVKSIGRPMVEPRYLH